MEHGLNGGLAAVTQVTQVTHVAPNRSRIVVNRSSQRLAERRRDRRKVDRFATGECTRAARVLAWTREDHGCHVGEVADVDESYATVTGWDVDPAAFNDVLAGTRLPGFGRPQSRKDGAEIARALR